MAHARLHLIWLMIMLAFARVLILILAFARVLILMLTFARVLMLMQCFCVYALRACFLFAFACMSASARVILKNFRVLRALTLRVCSLQRLAPAAKN